MDFFTEPVIQIAGIHDREEAELICASGIDMYAFPLRLPVHSEDLTDSAAGEIISSIPSPPYPVLITYLEEAKEISRLADCLDTPIVQLHGSITPEQLKYLKEYAPDSCIIKSLVTGKYTESELLKTIDELSPLVDAFITDTWDPETGADGATGKTHDWSISLSLRRHSDRPVILAGGLTPDNVGEAIETVKPAGVDVHTGVEDTAGRKDPGKLERFVYEARTAFRAVT